MANIRICHVTALLLVLSGIAEAETSIEQNDRESHDAVHPNFADDKAMRPEAWNSLLSSSSSQKKKKRATSEEDEGSELSAAYLRALAGDDDDDKDDEKRARSSFRGDLGKRMMHAMSRGMSSDAGYLAPEFWAAAADEKRFKVSSRFRGDLGKRAKSSFRGDLGKRFQSRYASSDEFTDGRIPKFETNSSYKFRGDKSGQTNEEMQYKDFADSGSRPFTQMRGN